MKKFDQIKSKQNYKIPIKEYIPNGKVENVIIACHGFGGDKNSSTIEALAEELNKYNIMVIAFDFPGHGESKADGEMFRVENCINDLITVEEYVKNKYLGSSIGIFATSYGAYITLLKINKYSNNYFSIVLRSPAICMDEIFVNSIIKDNMNDFKTNGTTKLGYEKEIIISYKYYEDLVKDKIFDVYNKNEEILIIQGTEDDMAPIKDSIRFLEEKNTKGKIIKIIGADHRMKKPGELEKIVENAVNYIKKREN